MIADLEEAEDTLLFSSGMSAATAVIDHLEQLERLDQEYQKLRKELLMSPNAKRIIDAIIYNFNTRISWKAQQIFIETYDHDDN